jgi:hypothetical protein
MNCTCPPVADGLLVTPDSGSNELHAAYAYYDREGSVEGASLFRWFGANDINGSGETEILGATSSTYMADYTNYNFFAFEITPVSLGSLVGDPVKSAYIKHKVVFVNCGDNFDMNHRTIDNVAPVDKDVIYGTKEYNGLCWLTQNLGAADQPTSADDVTEASAGWYWQFNRKQGYKHDGTTRTPNSIWISSDSDITNWNSANDPCSLLLGSAWRVPTKTEWGTVTLWNNSTGAYNSVLKLHTAGFLQPSTGQLQMRELGGSGYYWASSKDSSGYGDYLFLGSSSAIMYGNLRTNAYSIRCVRAL